MTTMVCGKQANNANRITLKWLRNFMAANFCAVLPLYWLAFGWMPDQVKIEAKGEESVSLTVNEIVLQGEEYGRWQNGTIWRLYLREGMEWEQLGVRLAEGLDQTAVREVRLEKWKLLSFAKSGAGLEQKDGETNDYVFSNPHFERLTLAAGKVPLCLAGIEILLLALSWWFAKWHREERLTTLWPAVLGVAFSLALLTQIALPVQSFVANRSAFSFTPGALLETVVIRFFVAWALGCLTLGTLANCFGSRVFAPMFAFIICAYLESGVLSIGLPSLNGNWQFFENTTRACWDGTVWGGIFGLVFWAHGILRNHYGIASLCLSGLIGASLLDIRPEPKEDSSKWIVRDFLPKRAVADSVAYADSNNVFVFIIDSLECAQAHAIMEDSEAGPRLREQFQGFTEYTNNIGTGVNSAIAIANLLTGKYPESATNLVDYCKSIFEEDSILQDYFEAGHAVYFIENKSFTNRRKVFVDANQKTNPMKDHLLDGLGWTLPGINRFRCLPFFLKLKYLRLASLGLLARDNLASERTMCSVLQQRDIDSNELGTFLFIHTDGVHLPIFYNRKGEHLQSPVNSDAGCIEMGVYVLGEVGKLFDIYRKKGIYDDALILVLADHGHHEVGASSVTFSKTSDLPANARPFLWIKPPSSTHVFSTSPLPTSHANIAALLRKASRKKLSEPEIQAILHSKKRLYRQVFVLEGIRKDWYVDADGGVEQEEGLLDKSLFQAELQPIMLGEQYSFDAVNLTQIVSHFRFGDMKYNVKYPAFYPDHSQMFLTFRVKEPEKTYRIRLNVIFWRYSGCQSDAEKVIHFHQGDIRGKSWMMKRSEASREYQEIELDGVVADEAGCITIMGTRGEGFESFVEFINLQVEENL